MKHTLHIATIVGCLAVVPGAWAQRVVPLGQGITTGLGVFDMIEYEGELVIGGLYSAFDGHARNNIQAWDGTQHFDLPGAFTGNSNRVDALELFEGDLIATGNDASVGNVARWNGIAWAQMGGGLSARGRALTLYNGELIIGGMDNRVSRWNGASWEALGADFNGFVSALAVYDGALYAGGSFTTDVVGGTDLKYLARWTGTTWEQVLTGLDGAVDALVGTGTGLVLGGTFNADGSGALALPHYSVFNGLSFSEELAVHNMGFGSVVCAHPEGGYLVSGSETVHVREGERRKIHFTLARAAAHYLGKDLIAGQVGNVDTYREARGIAEIIPGRDQETLDIGGIAASVTPMPGQFNRYGLVSGAGFEAPKGEGVNSIFSASPWVIGNEGEVLHSASPFYEHALGDTTKPWAGPLANDMDEDYHKRYHQVWKLDRNMIEDHIAHWADSGYEMPYAIGTWPGNGDLDNGEPAQLAPYKDLDGNSVYEPGEGEYPLIRGDQAIYRVLHSEPDLLTSADPMQLDIHVMTYAFADVTNADVYNTVFTNFRIVNRGVTNYTNARFGQFADLDIGCGGDDFVGCDSTLNLFFAYNWDELDEDCSGYGGYQVQPPAQGVMFLNRPMTSHRNYDNVGMPGSVDFLDAMQGTNDGLPFMELGYPTHFQFPGGNFTETIQAPSGRQSVGATGPFDFAPGDTLCIDMAFPFARATTGGAYASVEALKLRAIAVQAFYDAQNIGCSSNPDVANGISETRNSTGLRLYPNPANNTLYIERERGTAPAQVIVRSMSGATVATAVWPREQQRLIIDLSDIAPGVYAVEVMDGTQRQVLRMVRAD